MTDELHAPRENVGRIGFAVLGLLGVCLAGCAASTSPHGSADVTSAPATSDSTIVMALDLRRTAELSAGRDRYRIQSADLSLEFRSASNVFIDAGEVTLDGRPLERSENGTGKRHTIRYRARREALDGVAAPGTDGWVELAASGSSSFPPANVRVQIAPLPRIDTPSVSEAHYRSQGLGATIEVPPADVHVAVRLTTESDGFPAYEVGAGRYEFPADRIAQLAGGPAKVVIQTGTSCSSCPARPGLVLRWTTENEVEVPITIFE
jgi:hypothetical protein